MAAPTYAPRTRSSFVAAFLSFVFPGLGHAYAGAWARALAFATPGLLLASLLAGIVVRYGSQSVFFVFDDRILGAALVINLLLLAYRVVATIDAYRVTAYANAWQDFAPTRRTGLPRLSLAPLSVAGLLAVLLVMLAGHAVVAYWDVKVLTAVNKIHDTGAPAISTTASGSPRANGTPQPSAGPTQTVPPWSGGRLNVLLVGVDQRPQDATFNTDTMIVVSIDPDSHQVAMFSLPRDTVNVPLPPSMTAARSVYGDVYGQKINSLWTTADSRRDLFPGGGAPTLKAVLGNLYGIQIQYYVEVNFQGFQKVVDTLGGVTINVQYPVNDPEYPGDNGHLNLYIPPGVQHMSGAQALMFARSRHGTTDFDRAARQQQVVTAIEGQADLNAIENNLGTLIDELGDAVHTDIPTNFDGPLPKMIELAKSFKSHNVKSFVFSPPIYEQEINDPAYYRDVPYVDKIRAAVQAALNGGSTAPDATLVQQAVAEKASISVQNGTGTAGQATAVAAYMRSVGLDAQAISDAPATVGGPTRLLAVNGAEASSPKTLALLEQVLGVAAAPVSRPGQATGFVVVTGTNLPQLSPSPSG